MSPIQSLVVMGMEKTINSYLMPDHTPFAPLPQDYVVIYIYLVWDLTLCPFYVYLFT